jgi:hypothetical protein
MSACPAMLSVRIATAVTLTKQLQAIKARCRCWQQVKGVTHSTLQCRQWLPAVIDVDVERLATAHHVSCLPQPVHCTSCTLLFAASTPLLNHCQIEGCQQQSTATVLCMQRLLTVGAASRFTCSASSSERKL